MVKRYSRLSGPVRVKRSITCRSSVDPRKRVVRSVVLLAFVGHAQLPRKERDTSVVAPAEGGLRHRNGLALLGRVLELGEVLLDVPVVEKALA